ncbi:hypothetical protein AV530_007003 [Patagioenas fasciata monilis]|uniref:Uncharacterized protein n=1 Tax=Patagioenas fasciata monilis TaxID=372326 RepID=A0A1V4JLE6_PATFA|nr:hypothetical protein AV530_007003 [Patagioenas fasciata monilis]
MRPQTFMGPSLNTPNPLSTPNTPNLHGTPQSPPWGPQPPPWGDPSDLSGSRGPPLGFGGLRLGVPQVEYEGLTGRVEFNSKGQRTNYSLSVLESGRDGSRQVGVWFSNRTLAMDATTLTFNASASLANRTLIVTTILFRWVPVGFH